MYYAFLNGAGVNIGGWTVPQESSGTQVSLSALQPGDLLFWVVTVQPITLPCTSVAAR